MIGDRAIGNEDAVRCQIRHRLVPSRLDVVLIL
jgi:hypothetical protein